jgi:predicted MFS family arabinose efflux permease
MRFSFPVVVFVRFTSNKSLSQLYLKQGKWKVKGDNCLVNIIEHNKKRARAYSNAIIHSLRSDMDSAIQKRNKLMVQLDAVGIGLSNAATPFLAVFLTRLGSSSVQVGLLTTMPAICGLLLAIPLGHWLERQNNIIPWYSVTRFLSIFAYTLTGLIPFILPRSAWVVSILIIWGAITVPQAILSVIFSMVMSDIAGPEGRYELLAKRWSLMGLVAAVMLVLTGQFLERVAFPINYQIVFIFLSLGGILSTYSTANTVLPRKVPSPPVTSTSFISNARDYVSMIARQKPFLSYTLKRFIFALGIALVAPLFPLFFVRVAKLDDGWIANINTAQTVLLIIGYLFWSRQSKSRDTKFILLCAILGQALYPILLSTTSLPFIIIFLAGLAGFAQGGSDLVLFDELIKTIPPSLYATFISFNQGVLYIASIAGPMVSTTLSNKIGLDYALALGGGIELIGFLLFLIEKWNRNVSNRRHTLTFTALVRRMKAFQKFQQIRSRRIAS